MTTPVAAAWPSSPLPGRLARLLLTLPFWWSGVAKLLDFPSALAEVDHFGLHPPLLYAVLVIAVQLGGSILLVAGAWPWLAAGALAFIGLNGLGFNAGTVVLTAIVIGLAAVVVMIRRSPGKPLPGLEAGVSDLRTSDPDDEPEPTARA